MNKLCRFLLPLSLMLAPAIPAQQCEPPPKLPLTWAQFETVRDRILLAGESDVWRRIPWRTDLASAIADAAAENRPLLVWAMNGDPLGFT
jgi:hypothetical protein